MKRRFFLTALAAGALASVAEAHTLYGQWVVYRRKHLLIGCHREDPRTYELAQALVADLDHSLPAAKARIARARKPQRLASLIGTDQLEVAILSDRDAEAISAGAGAYAPYGKVPLLALGHFEDRVLVAHKDFPLRHAWLLAAAFHDSPLADPSGADSTLAWHPGAIAWQNGDPEPPL